MEVIHASAEGKCPEFLLLNQWTRLMAFSGLTDDSDRAGGSNGCWCGRLVGANEIGPTGAD